MAQVTDKNLVAGLTLLTGMFKTELTEALIFVYKRGLGTMDEAKFARAIDVCLAQCKFMPTAAEIREWAEWKDPKVIEEVVKRETQKLLAGIEEERQKAAPPPEGGFGAWMAEMKAKGFGSAQSMVDSCRANEREAAQHLAYARERYRSADPGTKECAEARLECERLLAEQRHWRDAAKWHEARVPKVAKPKPPEQSFYEPRGRDAGEDDVTEVNW